MKFSLSQLADLRQILKELSTGLNRLDFSENFVSFTWTGTIAAGATAQIRNKLDSVPTRMYVDLQTGNGLLTKGISYGGASVLWDANYVYVLNNGAASVTATITFFK